MVKFKLIYKIETSCILEAETLTNEDINRCAEIISQGFDCDSGAWELSDVVILGEDEEYLAKYKDL